MARQRPKPEPRKTPEEYEAEAEVEEAVADVLDEVSEDLEEASDAVEATAEALHDEAARDEFDARVSRRYGTSDPRAWQWEVEAKPPTIAAGGRVTLTAHAGYPDDDDLDAFNFSFRVLGVPGGAKLKKGGRKNAKHWFVPGYLPPGIYEAEVDIGESPPFTTVTTEIEIQPGGLRPGDLISVDLQRPDWPDTPSQAFWEVIKASAEAIAYPRYEDFVDWIFCGAPQNMTQQERLLLKQGRAALNARPGGAALPFPDIEPYKLLKAATEVFLIVNCGVSDFENFPFGNLAIEDADRLQLRPGTTLPSLWAQYLERLNGSKAIPYLELVRRKLPEVPLSSVKPARGDRVGFADAGLCYEILSHKLTNPCFLELIWSYWHEEGMLVQTLNAVSQRFQNMRGPAAIDPLANLELDPLRPLNNLLWGYIQDEQHRLTVLRRAYEYDHEYGLTLVGKAVPQISPADTRSKFLEAFHNLLHRTSIFYKDDDDTTQIADPFPVLNALRDVHLLLAEGAHNQYGDLPWTARHEMLMQQWLLARPEFREFLPTRIMVVYPEPWMDRIDAMKRLQGWTDISVRHFHDLARTGEMILLSIRFGNWSDIYKSVEAANWARFWRPEVQWYVQTYQTVTGIDLSSDISDVRQAEVASARYAPPAVHLSRRLMQQRSARQTTTRVPTS